MSREELYRSQYQHSFSLGGKRMATCVASTEETITLQLEPGVTKEEIEALELFKHLTILYT